MRTSSCSFLIVVGAAIAGATASAQASGIPSGTYRTSLTRAELSHRVKPADADSLIGAWSLTFDAAGHMTVLWKGQHVVEGIAQAKPGHRVYFDDKDTGQYACHMPATYRYSVHGSQLTFRKVSDKCDGRAAVLTTHPLAKGS